MSRKNHAGSVRKLSNGTYEYAASIGFDSAGKNQRKYFYGKTEAECHKKYKEFMRSYKPTPPTVNEAANMQTPPVASAETAIAPEYTLSEWLDVWLKTYKAKKVQKATYEDYVGLANHVKKHKIGAMLLSQVKPIDVTGYFADYSEYSHSFIKRSKFLVNAAFEAAIDNDLCDRNPVRRAEILKKAQPEKEAFSESEQQAILEFSQIDKHFGLAAYIMLNTGIRSGEMRSLTIDKIDFNTGVFTIDTAVKRDGSLGLTKSNKARYIPVKPEVFEFIRKNTENATGYIVGGKKYTTRPGFRSRYDCFFNRLNKWLESQNREPIEFKSPHALRHTFGTQCQKNGMPIAMVAALLGHHSTEVTDKYTHVGDVATLTEAVNKFGL
jgi:integrase